MWTSKSDMVPDIQILYSLASWFWKNYWEKKENYWEVIFTCKLVFRTREVIFLALWNFHAKNQLRKWMPWSYYNLDFTLIFQLACCCWVTFAESACIALEVFELIKNRSIVFESRESCAPSSFNFSLLWILIPSMWNELCSVCWAESGVLLIIIFIILLSACAF